MAASANPALYTHLVNLGTPSTILSLMGHENADIAIAAVKLLCELTDEDVVAEAEDAAGGEEGIKALVANLASV
jgi:beta-catenin-like protein 1